MMADEKSDKPEGKSIGKIVHFYPKISVAIIELTGGLKNGDKVKFAAKEGEPFEQEIASMQIEHEQIEEAKKGDAIGVKTDKPVKENSEVFKV